MENIILKTNLKNWEYTIPEGMEAVIENGKVIVKEKESDERIRKSLIKDFRNYYEMYDKSCGEPKWGSDRLLVKDILNTSQAVELLYKVGEMVYPDSFDEDRWNECSHGIHFFINKRDAIEY